MLALHVTQVSRHAFALAACLALLGAGPALAEESKGKQSEAKTATGKVAGEVLVILAKEAEGEMDLSLGSVKALKQPPFNTFKSMKILSRSGLSLAPKEAANVELPNGRRLQLELIERTADGRFKVQVSINRPNQKDYLPLLQVIASPGEPFFVAGQKHEGGTLVIGVRVGERPAK